MSDYFSSKTAYNRRQFLKAGGVITPALALVTMYPNDESLQIFEKEKINERDWIKPNDTEVILIPINKDNTNDDTGPMARQPLSIRVANIPLQVRNFKSLQINTHDIETAEIPITGGCFVGNLGYESFPNLSQNADQYIALSILSGPENHTTTKTIPNGEVLSGFTGLWMQTVYPAKLHNILEASRRLLEYQELVDGFSTADYSFLNILKIVGNRGGFKTGYDLGLKPTFAGGIESCSTLLSKSLFSLTEKGLATIEDRIARPLGYREFSNITAPEVTEENGDAYTQIESSNKGAIDFTWKMHNSQPMYLWIEGAIIPHFSKGLNNKWEDPNPDAGLMLTMTWRKTPPTKDLIDRLNNLQELYRQYRSGAKISNLQDVSTPIPLNWESKKLPIKTIRPEFKTDSFTQEINYLTGNAKEDINFILNYVGQSDEGLLYLKTKEVSLFYYSIIRYCQNTIEEYKNQFVYTLKDEENRNAKPKIGVGQFLKQKMEADGIFEKLESLLMKSSKKGVNSLSDCINDLDNNTYLKGDQPIQCVTWVSLLGRLGFPISPSYIGGTNIDFARGLLTEEAKSELKKKKTYIDKKTPELLFMRIDNIDEVQIGDSFIRYGGNNQNHIGTVIMKKYIEGKPILLVTDSNRKNDGLIRVFEVDEDYFRLIFGEGKEIPPIVIRNEKVQMYLKTSA